MPRRSNAFQRLITTIQVAIAPHGFAVEESALLADVLTGEEREVDVLITGTVAGGQEVRVAMECRDHARAATVEWIDELYGKYRDLPVGAAGAFRSSTAPTASTAPPACSAGRPLSLGQQLAEADPVPGRADA